MRRELAMVLAVAITATIVATSPTSAVMKSILSTCSFTLVNAGQHGEYVRAHCSPVDNRSDRVAITFRKSPSYSYVRSRVGKTLRCDVRVEQVGNQPARYGVFDCQN